MNKILSMLNLQQQLNDSTNGLNWEAGITKNGKKIDWKRCTYMECAEMIDSFAWKHWKSISAEPNWENHKIEVVDVWHFVMSLALQEYKMKSLGAMQDIVKMVEECGNYSLIVKNSESFGAIDEVMIQVEELMLDSLIREGFDIKVLVDDFLKLVSMSGLNLDSLYKLYVGKNILNQFRQDHGYKEGTYIKEWNGIEDNVMMKRVWDEKDDLTPLELYDRLQEIYSKL